MNQEEIGLTSGVIWSDGPHKEEAKTPLPNETPTEKDEDGQEPSLNPKKEQV